MQTRTAKVLATLSCIAVTAGCASSGNDTAGTASISNDDSRVIAEQESKISSLEAALSRREQELADARRAASASPVNTVNNELFPPNAEPGRCYARILTPAQYKVSEETVLAKEASERVEIIPAQYETVAERVLMKEASTRLEVVPARYETVEERVLVQPETTRIEKVPATYRNVSEQVLVTPARKEWKRGPASSFAAGVVDSRTTDTGEIMCLVEVPAVYKTVTRRVVDAPATTREITIPAVYKTVKKQVLATPATTREVVIPAEYGTVDTTKLVRKAEQRRIAIPAEYTTVTKREKVTEEVLAWREVVCEVNLDRSGVTALQTALKDAGYYRGPVDGIIGPLTLSSANAYAKAKGLPTGTNYIAVDVTKDLGISL
ncbi:MAG: peptidoglycan-binding domain-containing protein [Pseudomonadota bacterium]